MRPFSETGKKALYLNIPLFFLTGIVLFWGSTLFSYSPTTEDPKTIVKIWDLIRFTTVLTLITNLISFAEAGFSGYQKHKGTGFVVYGLFLFPISLILIMPISFVSILANIYGCVLPLAILHAFSFEHLTKYYAPIIERNRKRFDYNRNRLI